jgi:hypothetical protein
MGLIGGSSVTIVFIFDKVSCAAGMAYPHTGIALKQDGQYDKI